MSFEVAESMVIPLAKKAKTTEMMQFDTLACNCLAHLDATKKLALGEMVLAAENQGQHCTVVDEMTLPLGVTVEAEVLDASHQKEMLVATETHADGVCGLPTEHEASVFHSSVRSVSLLLGDLVPFKNLMALEEGQGIAMLRFIRPTRTGRVDWFNAKKGFGIIKPDDRSETIFVCGGNVMDGS